jgi:hypothetical protein
MLEGIMEALVNKRAHIGTRTLVDVLGTFTAAALLDCTFE